MSRLMELHLDIKTSIFTQNIACVAPAIATATILLQSIVDAVSIHDHREAIRTYLLESLPTLNQTDLPPILTTAAQNQRIHAEYQHGTTTGKK